jgi:hypothetical protein
MAKVGINAPYNKWVKAIADFRASPFGLGIPIANRDMRGICTIQAIQLMKKAGTIHNTPWRGEGQSNPPIVTLAPSRMAAGR